EYFLFLIEELNKEGISGGIFMHKHKMNIYKKDDGKQIIVSGEEEQGSLLSLSISGNDESIEKNIDDLIFDYLKEDNMSNGYELSNGQTVPATSRTRLTYCPDVFVFQVNAFCFNCQMEMTRKKMNPIKFNEIINIFPENDQNPDNSIRYEIIGVISHCGKSAGSGHYVNYCKDECGIWNAYNDEQGVVKIGKYSKCSKTLFLGNDELKDHRPYLIFARRLTPSSPLQ
ncbi:MAG: ubiquitin carboxyl-terminal hydrolase, partial [Puniceicoccales bacterium]|nr:ubiquitin carboxyl-terminal hydrolase [Puniceicoccales bacterium]